MNLPFSQKLNEQKTYFVEKIVKSLPQHVYNETLLNIKSNYHGKYEFNAELFEKCKPKLHTIRLDDKNRWRAGRLIHAVINNRSTRQLQFIPTIVCQSTQQFDLLTDGKNSWQIFIDKTLFASCINRVCTNEDNITTLAVNDGFSGGEAFLQHFNKPIHNGKIIHWTDLKY
jgi:hypothetical protein